tara:strand:+ start:41930 stop:43702 length:1773 start_codon:yes stop_codon:yes gene_type:complete
MKIWYLLSPQERKRAILLFLMIIVMAFLDTLGVASILPFMSMLTNPEIIDTNIFLNNIFQTSISFGIQNREQFLFLLGVLVLVLLVVSLSFKALTTYAQLRFVKMREYTIGKRLVEGYLHQPYSWFLDRNSADLGKNILSEVSQVIVNGMMPLVGLIANILISSSLIILLIWVNPKLSLIVGFSLISAYGIIFYSIRYYLKGIGKKRLLNNELRFSALSEAFGAAKPVKVGGLEKTFIDRFSKSAKIFASTQASFQVISLLPRYMLEAIAFGGILLIILYLMLEVGSFNGALPILSLYVFAGYRLMPSLQSVYGNATQLTFIKPALDKIYQDLKSLEPLADKQVDGVIKFDREILLKNIFYNYPNSTRKTLKNINICIPAKSTVGLVGATGSGKTTTVDIFLGLLEPQKGTLEVDGQVINRQNIRAWQRAVGYVPQDIYLSDDTVSANIAFGINPKDVDQQAIEKASKIANLHNFVIDELPYKYQTKIGERGVRLSGGQKQRIGIARALYNNPQVLILDEATSALDNETEQAVMDAVNNLSKDITKIIIAHRLNTVKNCDIVFKFEKGEVVNQGKFEEIMYPKDVNEIKN